MNLSKKVAYVGKECVACGCCEAVCPKNAITVKSGIKANVDLNNCVGCAKCAKVCPADVISIAEREPTK